ncbi:SemiSWEET family transporter [Enterococcus faecalis]|uniref:SemiSWEET family transporter n=1 Tax=Enterococcus faecalis TaxID=1351 RepID=UPI002430083A|nr:SemiSWEET family transporter [Enterococcus faecalis]
MTVKKKFIEILGYTASFMAIMMFVSYIPQIVSNLQGSKADPIQPLVTFINCFLWVSYGLLKNPRDFPLLVANLFGLVFGLVAFFTSL